MDTGKFQNIIGSALDRARNLFDYKNKYFWLMVIVGLLLIVLLVGLVIFARNNNSVIRFSETQNIALNSPAENNNIDSLDDKIEIKMVPRKIDGIMVEEGKENLPVLGVMIENHVDSRPPASLSKASIVYEAEAEGSITRFLALYATDEKMDRIGPVRSARPYYIDWALGYDALYVHCGGSPDALAKIIKTGVFDLNEFYNAAYFWRDNARRAPHNVYTSSEKLDEFINQKNIIPKNDYQAWDYKEEALSGERGSDALIEIDSNKPNYTIAWQYDQDENYYLRRNGGILQSDEDGNPITAKNIVFIYTTKKVVDDEGRLDFKTTGEGKAEICLDGFCREGAWSKPNASTRISFNYSDVEEASFNPGNTWIEVLPTWGKVNIKNSQQ